MGERWKGLSRPEDLPGVDDLLGSFRWYDAFCINQDDKDEQGQQVQQMGSIYSRAKRVIIWLGEATYDTDYVMYYMKQLEKEGFNYASNGQEISGKQWVDIWSIVVHDLRPDQRERSSDRSWSHC